MPVVEGLRPVMIAVRDGLHNGAAQYACSKRTPFSARRSIWGCLLPAGGPPRQPTQSFKSSTARNRTFGRSNALA